MMRAYPPPKNDTEFERLCCEVLKVEWDRPALHLYTKRGEAQFGVDIVDDTRPGDVVAVQCKCHEPSKPMPAAELRDEVSKADMFSPTIARYVICTTAKKSKAAQDAVAELNQQRVPLGKFPVELMFWEQMEAFLDGNDLLRERVLQSTHTSVRVVLDDVLRGDALARQMSGAVTHGMAAGQATLIDQDLDRVKRLLDENQTSAAAALLEDIKRTQLDRLSRLQRYRVLTNLGVVAFRNDDAANAGRLLLEGVDAYPEHECAAQNRAHGHGLLGNSEAAWEAAQEAIRRAPSSVGAAVAYVQTAPREVPLDELLKAIPGLRTHPEVLVAVAERALGLGAHEELHTIVAELRRTDEGPHALLLEALALIASQFPCDPREEGIEPGGRRSLETALGVVDRAFEAALRAREGMLAVRAIFVRLDVMSRLGNPAGVEEALDMARRVGSIPPRLATRLDLARAQLLLDREHFHAAVRMLDVVLASCNELDAHFLRAVALWGRNGASDRETARREVRRRLADAQGIRLEQMVSFVVRAEVLRDRPDDALEIVDGAAGIDPAHAYALRARIAQATNDGGAALDAAVKGFGALTSDTSGTTRRILAQVLESVGQVAEAVKTLEPLASVTALTSDTRNILGMAFNDEQHDTFLRYAEPLFIKDQLDEELLFAFLMRLEAYDSAKALRLVREAIDRATTGSVRKVLKIHEGLLAHANGTDYELASPDELPSVEEVPVRYVGPVVQVMLLSPHARSAADYAYRCVLRFQDEPAAHAALIRAYLFGSAPAEPVPDEVREGTRVEYAERGDSQPRAIVIAAEAVPGHPEIVGVESARAKRFLGRRVGDEVTLAEAATSPRTGTIKAIALARVHQLQRSMTEWQERFEEFPLLEQCRFETNAETGELDLSPMIAMLKRHADNVQRVDEIYRSGCVPVEMMADGVGRGVFDTMGHLANDGELFVNCVVGSDEVLKDAKGILDTASSLVIDGTALWAVAQLGLTDVLASLPIPVASVQQSIDELRRFSGKDGMRAPAGHLVLRDDGRLQYLDVDSPEEKRAREEWERLLAHMVREGARSSEPLAKVRKANRESIISYAGEWTAHVLGAATVDGAVLWSDDRVVEFIGKEFLGVKRVWTQAVLAWLVDRAIISVERFNEASARLHAMRFSGMLVCPATVVQGARLAGWRLGSPIFDRCLRLIGAEGTRPLAGLQMALALLGACARDVRLEMSRGNVVVAVVNELLRRDPTGALARALRRRLPGVIPLDPRAVSAMQAAVDAALRARMR